MNYWIAVDLDGTLAEYDHWRGAEHVGAPIAPMVDRVKRWLAGGKEVRIFTARVAQPTLHETEIAISAIKQWCIEQFGVALPITNIKDWGMTELWDDRCVQVEKNTGRRMDGRPEGRTTP